MDAITCAGSRLRPLLRFFHAGGGADMAKCDGFDEGGVSGGAVADRGGGRRDDQIFKSM